jgi:integrase
MPRGYASEIDPVATAFLVVERLRSNGMLVWSVKWRGVDDQRYRRRLGFGAWMEPDGEDGWKSRAGRPADGYLTEFQARRRVPDFVRAMEAELAAARERAKEPPPSGEPFRALAHAWLQHVADVGNAKPSTIRDYESMLAEPGTPYARGNGKRIGRIMKAIGDTAPSEITAADVDTILVEHSREGVGARSVNKHRQVLAAIFNFGLRPENVERWNLTSNPATATVKRKEPGPARLEVFTVEQIEAMARVAESGAWRDSSQETPENAPFLEAEDHQLGELIRIAAYTGLRRGELLALRWRDVDWAERVLVVERALSATVEGTTKGRKVRYVPLGDQALGALDRLSQRPNFTGPNDYVFANAAGDRIDGSALRRRYITVRDLAGAPKLRFHDLRHTAGTLLTRVLDPVTVRDVLGHADLKTTERYLHAVRASRLADAATRAFTPDTPPDRGAAARVALEAAIAQLGPDEARRILENVG